MESAVVIGLVRPVRDPRKSTPCWGGGGGGGLVREKGTRRICLPRGKRGVGDMLYIVVGIGKEKKRILISSDRTTHICLAFLS